MFMPYGIGMYPFHFIYKTKLQRWLFYYNGKFIFSRKLPKGKCLDDFDKLFNFFHEKTCSSKYKECQNYKERALKAIRIN